MARTLTVLAFISAFATVAFAQTPAFEVADVHESAKGSYTAMSGGGRRNDIYEVRHANMVELISTAYGVDADKVLGGPSWLEFDRFDVIAQAPPAASAANFSLMLQTLLADRFKLVAHRDSRPMPAFLLSVGPAQAKLNKSDALGRSGCQSQPVVSAPGAIPVNVMSCHNVTMQAFAQTLRDIANDYIGATIVDQTGLQEGWDFELRWTSQGLLTPAGAAGIRLFDAVDQQLGLKLELGKAAMPVIVVDAANQKPTANAPDVAARLGPEAPIEFEVAEIKASMPTPQLNGIGPGFGVQPLTGRIDVYGATLKELILNAWNFSTDDFLAGGPKSLETNQWDVIAKAAMEPGRQPDLRLMLRNLLIDRFNLKTHVEDRPVMAYTLIAVNPKLQKADPTGRTACKDNPPPNAIRSRSVTCTNITMAQFADRLPTIAAAYLQTPALDMTGLDGAFDFTLNFSTIGAFQRAMRGGADGAGQAADPTDAISVFEAMTKQLGLKLEMQKRPLPVLVIDHADDKPTEN